MPSCSVLHHCVLFLLTLTLTTDPGAAVSEFPIYAKLHQSVTLPCEAQCFGRGWWSLTDNRTVVFARCNQTSCRSEKQGYEMSHDQYKRGDLSLTITNPDYSMRNKYTCECDYSDYATWRLRISTEFSAVSVQTGGDLKLDLSVPESVEVIYRGSDSADGVHICNVTNNNVTQRSLQCNDTYTPRTSVSNSELTLRNMWRSESGTYTIRNLDYKEDIRVYAVSVSGLTSGETAGIVIVVLLLLVLLIAGVVYYMKRKAEWKRRQVESDKEAVNDLMAQALLKPAVEQMEELQQVEEKIKYLEQKYREDREYKDHITLFCKRKRDEMVESDQNAVNDLIGQAVIKPKVELKAVLQWVEEKIDALQKKYREDREYSQLITLFCYSKREELESCRKLFRQELEYEQIGEVKSELLAVYEDINETLHRAAVEEAELQRVEKRINDLQQKYRDDIEYSPAVMLFCNNKREYLRLYRVVFITRDTSLQPVTQERNSLNTEMKAVDDLIKQAELKPPREQREEMQEVLQKITDLEVKYRQTAEYYMDVSQFCDTKTEGLEYCRKFYGTKKETQIKEKVESEMDAVDDLIQKVLHTPPGEQVEKVLQEVKEKIKDLQQKYPDLRDYCDNKREELDVCREINRTQKGSLQPGTVGVIIKAVYKVIRENKHISAVEMKREIDDLEQKYKEYSKYYNSVGMFWNQKRTNLELCSRLGLLQLEFNLSNTEKEMEEVVKTLNELKWKANQNHTVSLRLRSQIYAHVSSSLMWISEQCREQRDNLKTFKQQLSDELRDDRMIRDVERHLKGLELWCKGKECELEIYITKLKQGGGETSDVDPQTSHNEGEENTALLEVKAEQK